MSCYEQKIILALKIMFYWVVIVFFKDDRAILKCHGPNEDWYIIIRLFCCNLYDNSIDCVEMYMYGFIYDGVLSLILFSLWMMKENEFVFLLCVVDVF